MTGRGHLPALALVFGLIITVVCWLWNLSLVPRLVTDDAFIFLRYATNLVDHGQLAFNTGNVGTDGFTSLGYQLVTALAYALHRSDPVAAAWFACVAIATAVVCITFLVPAIAAIRERQRVIAGIVASLLATLLTTSLSSCFAYWTQSLMDTVLVSLSALVASLAISYLLSTASPRPPACYLAGLGLSEFCLVRPEAFVLSAGLVALVICRLFAGGRRFIPFSPVHTSRRAFAITISGVVLVMMTYFGWHWARYGSAFPNPVYVKVPRLGPASTWAGVRYFVDGPFAGLLPDGSFRLHAYDGTAPQASHLIDIVKRPELIGALVSIKSRVFHLGMVFVAPLLFLVTLRRRLWRTPEGAARIRHLLVVPLGLWALCILGGGDSFHAAWRMVTPELPIIFMAGALVVPYSTGPWPTRIALATLVAFSAPLLWSSLDRPAICETTATECGLVALGSGPTTRTNYVSDQSMGSLDERVARALTLTFPPDTVIGQSDFQRISVHTDFPILDLSGLVNADLAHANHEPTTSLFTSRALVEAQPDIYFYGWHFWQPNALYRIDLTDPRAGAFLFPWEPRGEDGARFFAQILTDYVGASVALEEGGYFNFLVRRAAVSKMTRRDLVLLR